MAIKVVEVSSVTPSPSAAAAQSLPLVYFDIIFLEAPPSETLYFYDIKCSESCFLETIVVELKHSLSLTLKHFLPLASKIIFPLTSAGFPVSQYVAGDAVALTIALSDADMGDLAGNHSRTADKFHDYVPQLPPAAYSSDNIKFSPIAIQVTLFPNQGICFGFTQHHAICDLTSLFAFKSQWASIHKLNGDEHSVLPFYSRSCVQDADRLGTFVWNQVKRSRPSVSLTFSLPINKVRATYILSESQVEKLKKVVRMKKPGVAHVTSFVVVCAHLWSCLAKSAAAAGEEVADDEPEYLTYPMNCRVRLNPPLPETYFGNCLVFLLATSTHGRLIGKEGFVDAAEAIAAAIRSTVVDEREIMNAFENRLERRWKLMGKRWVRIAGSLRHDPYGADYGWGRGIKYECIHTDFDGAVSICTARDGGAEIGLSMPNLKMDYFAAMFNKNPYITSRL